MATDIRSKICNNIRCISQIMATYAQIIRSDNTCISSDKILRGVEREHTQETAECNITTSVFQHDIQERQN